MPAMSGDIYKAKIMRHTIGLGMLLAAIAASAPSTRAAPPLASALSCGLGLPPDAPGYAEAQAHEAQEAKQNGYLRVCDANLDRYRIAFGPLTTATAGLAFQPVELSGTPFARLTSLGGASDTDTDVRARLYRGFRTPDRHTVTLFEQDLSADGSDMTRAPADEPERVHGLPARLSVFQTPEGKAISHLSWREHRRWYELWIDANTASDNLLREQLFALAASLPLSIPACPNEPVRPPLQIGPNGFPIIEPAPAILTKDEMEARFDNASRPCK